MSFHMKVFGLVSVLCTAPCFCDEISLLQVKQQITPGSARSEDNPTLVNDFTSLLQVNIGAAPMAKAEAPLEAMTKEADALKKKYDAEKKREEDDEKEYEDEYDDEDDDEDDDAPLSPEEEKQMIEMLKEKVKEGDANDEDKEMLKAMEEEAAQPKTANTQEPIGTARHNEELLSEKSEVNTKKVKTEASEVKAKASDVNTNKVKTEASEVKAKAPSPQQHSPTPQQPISHGHSSLPAHAPAGAHGKGSVELASVQGQKASQHMPAAVHEHVVAETKGQTASQHPAAAKPRHEGVELASSTDTSSATADAKQTAGQIPLSYGMGMGMPAYGMPVMGTGFMGYNPYMQGYPGYYPQWNQAAMGYNPIYTVDAMAGMAAFNPLTNPALQ